MGVLDGFLSEMRDPVSHAKFDLSPNFPSLYA
jgi:hypothetical protein